MSIHGRVSQRFVDSNHSLLAMKSTMHFNRGALHDPSVLFWGTRTRHFFYDDYDEGEEEENPRWRHHLPPHPTLWDRLLFPIFSFRAWLRLLGDNYDWRFIVMIVCGQHLLKGMLSGGGSQGMLVVEGLTYMRLQVGAAAKVTFQSVSQSAWGLKPLYALISDAFSIHGYRRTPWVLATAVVAFTAYLTLLMDSHYLNGALVCLCFFCAKLQLSWTDLMVEATYTEKMREKPRYAADVVSFAWSGIAFCGLVGIVIAGPGVDILGPLVVLALAVPIAGLVVLPASAGWLGEKRLPTSERGFRLKHFRRQWKYFACTMILTLGVMLTMISGILRVGPVRQAMVASVVVVVTGTASVVLLPSAIWQPLMFMFLANSLSISTAGFVDNFYLDPATPEESLATGYPVCVDCPHFSATFYYTVMGIADSCFMLLGSTLFSRYMSNWSYCSALAVSQVLIICCSSLDIVQYQRWNLVLGIPDWVFMLGKCSVQNTIGMINFMPTTILISKICPEGMEASVFALLAGFSNFGNIVSGYFGAFVLTLLGLDAIGKGKVDDFSNAWKACLIGAMSSFISLLLMPFLIPAKSMSEELMKAETPSPEEVRLLTNGSLLFDEDEY
eukprot:GGOE01005379.1.p1 GENE.GGOE01005379.1~~GGOE01005379.1.p1  ORF type:complete len:613 (-),score=226.53 GGOE01005379.1:285-2123(-)